MRVVIAASLSLSAMAAALSGGSTSGMKIVTRQSISGIGGYSHATLRTDYIAADRSRMDLVDLPPGTAGAPAGSHWASITRCDLHQMFSLDFAKRQYDWMPRIDLSATARRAPSPRAMAGARAAVVTPTFLIETTTRDTGERKIVFERTARRVITTRREIPFENSSRPRSEDVSDGWYTDLDTTVSCDKVAAVAGATVAVTGYITTLGEWAEFKYIGAPETGFLIEGRTSSHRSSAGPDGTSSESTWSSDTIVTELTEGPLDVRLFDIPSGFRERPISWSEWWTRYWMFWKARVEAWFP